MKIRKAVEEENTFENLLGKITHMTDDILEKALTPRTKEKRGIVSKTDTIDLELKAPLNPKKKRKVI